MKKTLLSLALLLTAALSLPAQQQLTVADGTDEHSWFPLPSNYFGRVGSRLQIMYPAEFLTDMVGADITSLKFFVVRDHGMHFAGGKHRISMASTSRTYLGNTFIEDGLQVVCNEWEGPEEGTFEIEMVFDEPFTYAGGSLIYDWVLLEEGYQYNYVTSFHGMYYYQDKDYYYNSIFMPYSDNPDYMTPSYMNMTHFIPKTTFTFERVHVTAKTLDFGELLPNGKNELKFKVKNINSSSITPTISGLTAPFSTTYTPTSLASGNSTEITIKFNPTELGNFNKTITVSCGSDSYPIVLKGKSVPKKEITVCNGGDKEFRVPIDLRFVDANGTYGQAIYPAEMLQEVKGNNIVGVKFYPTEAISLNQPTFEFSMGGTSQSVFGNPLTNLTLMCSTTIPDNITTMEFDFNQPYSYNGGNLAIQTSVKKGKDTSGTEFYGVNQATNTAYTNFYIWTSHLTEEVPFLPKMTIICKSDLQPSPGDVNLDNLVNVSDVTALINMILGIIPVDKDYGDVNKDGSVNVSDITRLINIILGNI